MCAASRRSTPCPTSPRSCARRLSQHYSLARPEIVTEQVSIDGTRKWLLRLARAGHDARAARDRDRLHPRGRPRHACASRARSAARSPARFCHTGTQRLVRNLTRAGDRRPDPARARPHRRLEPEPPVPKTGGSSPKASARSPTSCSWAWASRSTTSTTLRRRWRSPPTAKGSRSPSGASRCRPRGVVPEIARWGAEIRHHARDLAARHAR